MLIVSVLIALYFLYLFLEYRANRKARRSFLHVIHVNGIRGKTGTCRTLDAALRAKYKVFSKTTGTDAATIDVNGIESPIRRLGPASIHEQVRILRKAYRQGAEILIIECMAVNPDLQKTAQEQIVMGDISVITNVRYDHILDMGETKEEIAAALSGVIPEKGILVSADPDAEHYFGGRCRSLGTELIVCPSKGDASDNIAIARRIAERLGITGEAFEAQLSGIHEDFGVNRLYEVSGPDGVPYHFLNLFSVNEPESTEANLKNALQALAESAREGVPTGHATAPPTVYFLYNHRTDRPDRALLFSREFFPNHQGNVLYLMGPGLPLPRRLFKEAGVSDIRILKDGLPNLPKGSLLAGIGNIKGPAYTLIEELNRGISL